VMRHTNSAQSHISMGAEASKPGVGPAFVRLSKEAVPATDTAFWK